MLLGEIGVGKTSLVRRLALNEFGSEYRATIGVDIYEYACPPSGPRPEMAMMLWDTEGDLGESILEHVYCKGAAAALVIGDVSRPSTIDTALSLADKFEERFPGRPALVVLNKIDLLPPGDAVVDRRLAGLVREQVAATSAKTGERVAAAIGFLADILDRRRRG